MFLGWDFLFTPLDTFAVECIIQPQNAPKKNELQNFCKWNVVAK